jgi:hypothetical protein
LIHRLLDSAALHFHIAPCIVTYLRLADNLTQPVGENKKGRSVVWITLRHFVFLT